MLPLLLLLGRYRYVTTVPVVIYTIFWIIIMLKISCKVAEINNSDSNIKKEKPVQLFQIRIHNK